MTREQLNEWLPTVVRYLGAVLTVALVIANILGSGVELAAGYAAAAWMLLYKFVRDGASEAPPRPPGPPAEPPADELPHEERWSHLG